jgi:hypothetical protein
MTRIRRSGTVRVARPPDEAMELFTARGERRWVDGWEPRFPAGDEREDRGAVWLTEGTTWVIAARDDRSATYARVSPGVSAGLVDVACEPDGDAGTLAHVTYDLTALDDATAAELERFAAGFDAFLAEWERAIASAAAPQARAPGSSSPHRPG